MNVRRLFTAFGLGLLLTNSASADFVYGIKSTALGAASTFPARLFRFDENGTGFTDLGVIRLGSTSGAEIDVDALGISQNRQLYAYQVTTSGSRLVSINATNAVATTIGSQLNGRDMRGGFIDGLNVFWAIDSAMNQLLSINTATGAIVSAVALKVGSTNYNVGNAIDLAQLGDGSVYLTDSNQFFRLNLSTGNLTHVHTDTGGSVAYPGLAASVSSASQQLFGYDVNGTDDIFKFGLPGFSRSPVFPNIMGSFNSGRGDLASVTVPEPMTLAAGVVGLLFGAIGAGRRWRRTARG